MDAQNPLPSLPPPLFSCGLRWDFAVEMGLVDLLRAPRPIHFFVKRRKIAPDNPDAAPITDLMNVARMTTPVPRWTLACSAWVTESAKPGWWLSNGDEWLFVTSEGLWVDMLQRMVREGLPMARLVSPKPPSDGGPTVYGEVALVHDANCGRLTAHPTSKALDFVRRRKSCRIEH